MAIQKLLIQYILEPLACFMDRFRQKTRSAGFVLAGLAIFVVFFAREMGMLGTRYILVYALSCLFLALMILFSLKKGLKPVKFRVPTAVCWFGVGALMALSGVLFNTDYLAEALLILAAYPVAFIVWQNADAQSILKNIIRSVQWSFVLYAVICLIWYPMDGVRYQGLFKNVNGAAAYLALSAICFLAECLQERKISWPFIGRLLLLGVSGSLLYYTSSRTGVLSFVLAAAVAVVIYFVANGKKLQAVFFRNAGMAVLALLVCFNVTIYLFQFEKVAQVVVDQFQSALNPDTGVTPGPDTDPSDKPDSSSKPGIGTKPNKPSVEIIDPGDSIDKITDRFDTTGQNANQISSGRIKIWEGYLAQLNLLGHEDSGTVVTGTGKWQGTFHTAHMAVLQIAYENGVVAGVLYLVFNLLAGGLSVWYAVKNKDNAFAAFPLMITAMYAVYSLLASTATSFLYLATFIYYLVQFPLLTKQVAQE